MHRVLTLAAVAATLIVAGCGGTSQNNATTGASMSDTVGVKQVDGIGRVLVDASGLALYTPNQETAGMIRCTGSCTSIWQPVDAGAHPSAAAGAGKVGVVKRPDGVRQVTLAGMPLYTFAQDSPDQVTGDGAKDQFDGKHFTWHVVLAGGSKGTGTATSSSGRYGY